VDFHWNPADPWTLASVSSGDGGNTLQLWRMNDLIYRPEEEALAELEKHKEIICGVPAAAAGSGGGGGGGGGGGDGGESDGSGEKEAENGGGSGAGGVGGENKSEGKSADDAMMLE
jgi:histone-binding protein RBBP4